MGKVLLFIFDEMTDYEITFITHLLSVDAGKEIITISYEDKLVKSASGLKYKADKLVGDVLDIDVEGIIVCGGWYGEVRGELIKLISDLDLKGKLLAGICGAGTVFLAKAGILNEAKYTTPITEWTNKHIEIFGHKDPFPRRNFIDKRVVRDGNVITAQGIAFIDFAVEICDWFNLFENQQERIDFNKSVKGEVHGG